MADRDRSAVAAVVGLAAAGVTARRVLRARPADVTGDVVIVTGSSRGLGFLLAREFGRLGARVVLCARSKDTLDVAVEDLRRSGVDAIGLTCDVTNPGDVARLVEEATNRYGRVDTLVNNAGTITVGPIQAQTLEDFRDAMGVMFWGTVHPTLAVLPQMLERRAGRIVNVTSIGGKISAPHLLPYNSAKFAAVGFSEGLRAEVSRYGVSVTTVVPGLMRTGSPLNAFFKGNHRAEYAWFSAAASLPLVSMDAERAARRIVDAARRGQAELLLTPQAHLAARMNGLAPGLTADLLGIVNRLLPRDPGTGVEHRTGMESRTPVSDVVTALGERAARRFHQYGGEGRPKPTQA